MTADTVGGVWTCATDLARELARRGIDVHLATMGGPVRPDQRAQVAGCRGITLHEGGWRLEWMESPWDDVELAGEWLLALERELRPHVVHLNQFCFGSLPFRAPRLVVAHSCVLSWWQAVHGSPAPPEWSTYRHRVAAGLAGASLVAAPTRAMLDSLPPHYGVLPRSRVLPNGRDARLFAPQAKEPVVFAAGRLWDEAKNLAALDAAAQGLPWPVQVAGACEHPGGGRRAPAHAVALGLLPAQAVAARMARAAIYALPARYEPFGLSVLEAGLSGCALVLGDIPSLREVWGDAALYVPPDDPHALRRALAGLIEDAPGRERLAARARTRAQRFGAARMADAYLDAYAAIAPAVAPAFAPPALEDLPCA
jgi:glycosyltransferase involved in cell wall biosynthesis